MARARLLLPFCACMCFPKWLFFTKPHLGLWSNAKRPQYYYSHVNATTASTCMALSLLIDYGYICYSRVLPNSAAGGTFPFQAVTWRSKLINFASLFNFPTLWLRLVPNSAAETLGEKKTWPEGKHYYSWRHLYDGHEFTWEEMKT